MNYSLKKDTVSGTEYKKLVALASSIIRPPTGHVALMHSELHGMNIIYSSKVKITEKQA